VGVKPQASIVPLFTIISRGPHKQARQKLSSPFADNYIEKSTIVICPLYKTACISASRESARYVPRRSYPNRNGKMAPGIHGERDSSSMETERRIPGVLSNLEGSSFLSRIGALVCKRQPASGRRAPLIHDLLIKGSHAPNGVICYINVTEFARRFLGFRHIGKVWQLSGLPTSNRRA
jgi:hypothetical protein